MFNPFNINRMKELLAATTTELQNARLQCRESLLDQQKRFEDDISQLQASKASSIAEATASLDALNEKLNLLKEQYAIACSEITKLQIEGTQKYQIISNYILIIS